MTKKAFSCLLIIAMLIQLLSFSALAADPAFSIQLDLQARKVTVAGSGFASGQMLSIIEYLNADTGFVNPDYLGQTQADTDGNFTFTYPSAAAVWAPGDKIIVKVNGVSSTQEVPSVGLGDIRIRGGLISGIPSDTQGVELFKGVPFAKPPVGALRWKAPQDLDENAWEGVRACDTNPNRAYQSINGNPPGTSFWGDEFYYDERPEASEDCLYMNIYTPAKTGSEKLPVLLNIHGGGFNSGWASEVEFNASKLAANGIIVVETQYRLGSFGFLTLPGLNAENENGVSGNYAILDLVKSLEWVNNNIEAFGGDPSMVTISGQSAGSWAVQALLSTPLSKGLFSRAILQSNLAGFLGSNSYTPYGTLAAKQTSCENAVRTAFGTTDPDELRKIDAATLLSKSAVTNAASNMTKDGFVFTDESVNLRRDGALDGIDLLIGGTSNENTSLSGNPSGTTNMTTFMNNMKNRYGKYGYDESAYAVTTNSEAYRANLRCQADVMFAQYRVSAMYTMAHSDANVYAYYFDHNNPPHSKEVVPTRDEAFYGAYHSSELWYVFNSMRDSDPKQRLWRAEDHALADTISAYWANFVKYGNPNGAGMTQWNTCNSSTSGAFMSFIDGEAAFGTATQFPERDRVNLLYARDGYGLTDYDLAMQRLEVKNLTPSNIVAGHAANIKVSVRAVNFIPSGITVSVSDGETEYGRGAVGSDGTVLIACKKLPAAGKYTIKATAGEISREISLDVTDLPAGIWSPTLSASTDGATLINFALKPEANAAAGGSFNGCVTVKGLTQSIVETVGNSLKVPFLFSELASGDKITVRAVKFPLYFPSYSFTFTITV